MPTYERTGGLIIPVDALGGSIDNALALVMEQQFRARRGDENSDEELKVDGNIFTF